MQTLQIKEKMILAVVGVVVLYAVAGMLYLSQAQAIRMKRTQYTREYAKRVAQEKLIAATDTWQEKYAKMRQLMPVFPLEKDVDTHWLNMMDSLATTNHLAISRRQTGKEIEVGDVFELPIECKDWEGSLEAVVNFLYALHQEGAMLDIRQLYLRPASKTGFLKGTFTLTCAYMRSDDVETDAP